METVIIRFLRAMEKKGHTGAILIKSKKKLKILEVWKKKMFALCNEKVEHFNFKYLLLSQTFGPSKLSKIKDVIKIYYLL